MFRLAAQQSNVEAELKLGDYCYYGWGQVREQSPRDTRRLRDTRPACATRACTTRRGET